MSNISTEHAHRPVLAHTLRLFAVPIMLQRILDLPERVRRQYDLAALRIVASSGSALPGPFVTRFLDTFGDIFSHYYYVDTTAELGHFTEFVCLAPAGRDFLAQIPRN